MHMVKITQLTFYPIKGCQGINLNRAIVGPLGLESDRQWAVFDPIEKKRVTQIDFPRLAAIRTELSGEKLTLHALGREPLIISARPMIESDIRDEGDEAAWWVNGHLGTKHLRLARKPLLLGSFAYSVSFLVISDASLADLNGRLPKPIPMDRFRPNMVVSGCEPYEEDTWDTFSVGGIVFKRTKDCIRCAYTTTDQLTGERDGAEPLKTLATYRKREKGVAFGAYFTHEGKGSLAIGGQFDIVM